MKKLLLYTMVLASLLVFATSCEKDEIGGTATEKMAGEWYVTVVAVDENGGVVYSDDELYGIGHFHLDTYNTADNGTTKMWINDNGNFWDFKVKMDINFDAMTFSVTNGQNEAYDSKVTITDGKILYGAATTPSGMPADSISCIVTFDDDTNPDDYGFAAYRVAGFRYTGLTGDE